MRDRLIGWKKDEPHWRRKAIESVRELVEEISILEKNLQRIHTPWVLCNQILDQLAQEISLKDCGHIAVLFNLEFVQCLIERGISPRRIWFFADASLKGKRAKEWYNVNVLNISYDNTKKNEKRIKIMPEPKPKKQFDVVIQNPPYQGTSGNKGAGNILWDKFVLLANSLTRDSGHIAMVHPSLWRKPNHKLQQAMMENRFLHLEIHDEKDGMKTFGGAETRYDWYISQRRGIRGKTTVVAQDGKTSTIDLAKLPFVPNYAFSLVMKLVGKNGEPKVEILHSESAYEPRKAWMSDEKSAKFKHPCVYTVGKSVVPSLKWSSRTANGHFGVPKVIYSSGRPISVGFLVDSEGKYGLTQWASGIVDTKANLPKIAKALSSQKFREFCAALSMSKLEINTAVLRCFRKDFWREFV